MSGNTPSSNIRDVRERFLNIMRRAAQAESEMGQRRGPGAAEDYLAVEQEALKLLDQWAESPAQPPAPEAAP